MARLAAAQRDFANGDAAGLSRLYSHREDVTVLGGFGGLEHGWAEVGPRLEWAASHFSNAFTVSRTSVLLWEPTSPAWSASNIGPLPIRRSTLIPSWNSE